MSEILQEHFIFCDIVDEVSSIGYYGFVNVKWVSKLGSLETNRPTGLLKPPT